MPGSCRASIAKTVPFATVRYNLQLGCGSEIQASDGAILSDGWILDGLGQVPGDVLDGASVRFAIFFDPPAPREETNVVVFELFDGTTERRFFTVRGLEPEPASSCG